MTGALWHLSTLPAARLPILEAGAVEPLVLMLEGKIEQRSRGEEEDEEDEDENGREERLILTALTVANLSMAYQRRLFSLSLSLSLSLVIDFNIHIFRKELPSRLKDGLTKMSEFIHSKDYTRFTLHNLIWTTLKPLCDLLEAPHWEVNEIGTFITNSCHNNNF